MYILLTKKAQKSFSFDVANCDKPLKVIAKISYSENRSRYLVKRNTIGNPDYGAGQNILNQAIEKGLITYSIMNQCPAESFKLETMRDYWWIDTNEVLEEIRLGPTNNDMVCFLIKDGT